MTFGRSIHTVANCKADLGENPFAEFFYETLIDFQQPLFKLRVTPDLSFLVSKWRYKAKHTMLILVCGYKDITDCQVDRLLSINATRGFAFAETSGPNRPYVHAMGHTS